MLPPVTVPGREAAMGAVPAVGQHSAAAGPSWASPPIRVCPPVDRPELADGPVVFTDYVLIAANRRP
jgi:hypothetical protein